jgi:hypothetical protein
VKTGCDLAESSAEGYGCFPNSGGGMMMMMNSSTPKYATARYTKNYFQQMRADRELHH